MRNYTEVAFPELETKIREYLAENGLELVEGARITASGEGLRVQDVENLTLRVETKPVGQIVLPATPVQKAARNSPEALAKSKATRERRKLERQRGQQRSEQIVEQVLLTEALGFPKSKLEPVWSEAVMFAEPVAAICEVNETEPIDQNQAETGGGGSDQIPFLTSEKR